MFTRQVELLNGLRGLAPEEFQNKLLDVLAQMVGNCSQPLAHRGPVNIDINGSGAPDVPYTAKVDESYAGLHVYNDPSFYTLATNTVSNAFAADFLGVVRVRAALAQNNPAANNIAFIVQGDILTTSIYVTNIYNIDGTSPTTIYAKGLLNGALTTGSSTATIDTVVLLSPTPFTGTAAPTSANNILGLQGADNAPCWISRNAQGTWDLVNVQLDCVMHTELQLSGSNELQIRETKAVTGVGSWTTWHTPGLC